jgi:hypothetical protein
MLSVVISRRLSCMRWSGHCTPAATIPAKSARVLDAGATDPGLGFVQKRPHWRDWFRGIDNAVYMECALKAAEKADLHAGQVFALEAAAATTTTTTRATLTEIWRIPVFFHVKRVRDSSRDGGSRCLNLYIVCECFPLGKRWLQPLAHAAPDTSSRWCMICASCETRSIQQMSRTHSPEFSSCTE